jgi:hypothetical protein
MSNSITEPNIPANNPCLSCYLQHSILCNPDLCMARSLYINIGKTPVCNKKSTNGEKINE